MARMDAARQRPTHLAPRALLLVAAAALMSTGCTTGSRSTADSFRLIFHKPVEVSPEAIAAKRFPQILIQAPDITAIAVLGYVDNGRQQWYAGNQVVFETDNNGVLLSSDGLKHQRRSRILGKSPFESLRTTTSLTTVTRQYDWVPEYQVNVPVTGKLAPGRMETVEILKVPRRLQRFEEELSGPNFRARNTYWVDPSTGFIWKSRQYLAPGYPVEVTQLKPYRPTKE